MRITTFAYNIYLNDLEYNCKNNQLISEGRRLSLIPIGADFKKGNNIVLTILEEKDKRTTYSLPLNEFNHAVKEGLNEFYNHLNHDYIRNDFDSHYYFKLKDIYTDIC
ncbi:hypothetical protein QNJ39_06285 [Macrococcus caseolyticus]|uniref:hypothetical protein n=1 Tax=Macrococcoides caseolyticum TaxID=69966 RepID=UPI0024BD1E3D|nr:hypothetical protein [Macrococcus caseolyticus]MDJ1091200.1 hypothetical protein [Macrococcus caseolyticus]MDJ1153813.1 hypothetical protein [Macrococcus caseolyticus]